MTVSYGGVSRRVSPSDSLFVLFQDNANGLEDPLEDVGVGVFGQEVEEEGVAHIAPTQHRVYHVTIRIVPHTSFPPVKKEPLTQAFFLNITWAEERGKCLLDPEFFA